MPTFKFRRIVEVGQKTKLFLDLKGGVVRGEVPNLGPRPARQSKRLARQSRRIRAQSRRLEEYQRQIELLKELVPENDLKRVLWESGMRHEAQWWRKEMKRAFPQRNAEDRKLALQHDHLDPELPLQERIVEHLNVPQGEVVSILDIGAGPLTRLGKKWQGRTVEITAIDPLADYYALGRGYDSSPGPIAKTIQDAASELRRIPLPRIPVNRLDTWPKRCTCYRTRTKRQTAS